MVLAAAWFGAMTAGVAHAAPPSSAAMPLSRQPAVELLARCERFAAGAAAGDAGAAECLAFVDGFVWGHGWRAWRDDTDMYFCPPETAPVAAAIPAVVDYLRSHPERLDQPAHVMLFAALRTVWPCGN